MSTDPHTPNAEAKPVTIRLQQKTLDQLRASAREADRSVSGEVRHLITEHLARADKEDET